MIALLILVGLALLFWAGFEYALEDFRKLIAIYEVGAGASTPRVEVEEPSVLVASLTAAGADSSRPFDWEVDVA